MSDPKLPPGAAPPAPPQPAPIEPPSPDAARRAGPASAGIEAALRASAARGGMSDPVDPPAVVAVRAKR